MSSSLHQFPHSLGSSILLGPLRVLCPPTLPTRICAPDPLFLPIPSQFFSSSTLCFLNSERTQGLLQPVSPSFCSGGLGTPSPRHSPPHPIPSASILPACTPSRACTDQSWDTNPIRKSSRWLRVMRRPRKLRRSWQLRGLRSSTKAKKSSQQPETNNQGAGQPGQAMLGPRTGGGAERC